MVAEERQTETALPVWPGRVGLLVESPGLAKDIADALEDLNARPVFRAQPTQELFETVRLAEREKPDVIFVELSRVPGNAQSWIDNVRGKEETLVVAVHKNAEPEEMIAALRAGACEFIHLPVKPSLSDAMDRIANILENRRSEVVEKGFASGFLSAKGGCGATTIACHAAVAASNSMKRSRVLVADLDCQAPAAHTIFRISPQRNASEAFVSNRRLNAANWRDFVDPVLPNVDLLAGSEGTPEAAPDAWRVDNLFRFVTRQYGRVIADLGRNLNPVNFAYLQALDELIVVTAPDVLALYQTRQILQALSNRGFEKSRVRLILNRNHLAPEDFWVESIEQMFEMGVTEVIPNDYATLNGERKTSYEFPEASSFGRTMNRLAAKLISKPSAGGRTQ